MLARSFPPHLPGPAAATSLYGLQPIQLVQEEQPGQKQGPATAYCSGDGKLVFEKLLVSVVTSEFSDLIAFFFNLLCYGNTIIFL